MSFQELPFYLKDQFLKEFNPAERLYFLKKAKEAVFLHGYVPGEDLYHYCYFLTQKKRLESLTDPRAGGLFRYLMVEGLRDIDEALKMYKERLEKNKRVVSFEERDHFIRFLEEP